MFHKKGQDELENLFHYDVRSAYSLVGVRQDSWHSSAFQDYSAYYKKALTWQRAYGLAENLGLDTARIKHTTLNGEKLEITIPGGRHELALQKILALLEQYHFIAVGHRVVHGGREYSKAVRVDQHVLDEVMILATH